MSVINNTIVDKDIFLAQKFTNNDRIRNKGVIICSGDIKVSDFSITEEIQNIAKGQLDKLRTQQNNYLNKWDKYGEKEGEILFDICRRVGKISFSNIEVVENGVKFFINNKV